MSKGCEKSPPKRITYLGSMKPLSVSVIGSLGVGINLKINSWVPCHSRKRFVWKIIMFLSWNHGWWVICEPAVNLPGCNGSNGTLKSSEWNLPKVFKGVYEWKGAMSFSFREGILVMDFCPGGFLFHALFEGKLLVPNERGNGTSNHFFADGIFTRKDGDFHCYVWLCVVMLGFPEGTLP